MQDQTPSWIATLRLPINPSKALTPTFLSPPATRRYTLKIHLKKLGLHHGLFELEAPIQVIADPTDGIVRPVSQSIEGELSNPDIIDEISEAAQIKVKNPHSE